LGRRLVVISAPDARRDPAYDERKAAMPRHRCCASAA
jgi:hypothetical protein